MTEVVTQWSDELQATLDQHYGVLQSVTVLQATVSTQDAARQMDAQPGHVIVAARQSGGRGRMGRQWADTHDDGIAVTMVLPRETGGRLAIAGAIAAAVAAESCLDRRVGIKWPNDIVVNQRKLAGVLVEQVNDVAMVGIGMNVSQTHWPDELSDRAVSLRQLQSPCDRLSVLKNLLKAANDAFVMNEDQLATEFSQRDALLGTVATFFVAGTRVTGTVLELSPLQGLLVGTAGGERWLDAATTSLRAG